ncbi:hypothetical protein CCH79_00007645, partial [Gambusia affinis]
MLDDRRVARSNRICYRERKESMGILPERQSKTTTFRPILKDEFRSLQICRRTRMEGDRMEVTPIQNIHVEVHVKSLSTAKPSEVKMHVQALLNRHSMTFGNYRWTEFDDKFLHKHVDSVVIDLQETTQPLDLKSCDVSIHVFTLNEEGPSTLNLEEDEDLSAANHWLLPAAEFDGLWESLVYETGVKAKLLDYVTTTIYFSDKNVDSNLISWNRVVLLHGPPGTGKTSLCKALAQKLSIRLSSRYTYGQFVEINSHSLFSKWFSESGKLVTKMFQKIQLLIDDKDALVFVLIDEPRQLDVSPAVLLLFIFLFLTFYGIDMAMQVESLTAARKACQAGTEPSDAIRVVNAVLTQLDQIKRYPNVVILTTSNVTEKIDLAFVDRADIKQYIGPPSEKGIYNIYLSCLEELMKCQIIYPRQQLFTMYELETMGFVRSEVSEHSLKLRNIAVKSKGLSGRALRKLPFLAHALFVQQTPSVTLERFLKAMCRAVDKQREEEANLINGRLAGADQMISLRLIVVRLFLRVSGDSFVVNAFLRRGMEECERYSATDHKLKSMQKASCEPSSLNEKHVAGIQNSGVFQHGPSRHLFLVVLTPAQPGSACLWLSETTPSWVNAGILVVSETDNACWLEETEVPDCQGELHNSNERKEIKGENNYNWHLSWKPDTDDNREEKAVKQGPWNVEQIPSALSAWTHSPLAPTESRGLTEFHVEARNRGTSFLGPNVGFDEVTIKVKERSVMGQRVKRRLIPPLTEGERLTFSGVRAALTQTGKH